MTPTPHGHLPVRGGVQALSAAPAIGDELRDTLVAALGDYAKPAYEFLIRCDLAAFIPTDNYFKVMGHRRKPAK